MELNSTISPFSCFKVNLFLGITVSGVLLANLNVTGNGREGIFMRNSRGNVFNRVFLQKNGGHGIFLAKSELPDSAAVGNVFANFVFSGAAGGYVRVNDRECEMNSLVNPVYTGEKFVNLYK